MGFQLATAFSPVREAEKMVLLRTASRPMVLVNIAALTVMTNDAVGRVVRFFEPIGLC